ncbi:MAG: hypothetical protein WBQ16_12010, partial [Nitrososphaeraceae archaeon]
YSESQLSRDVEKVVSLLPSCGSEVTVKDIKQGLSKYGFDESYQNKIVQEAGTNHKNVRARRNSYSHSKGIDDIYMKRI